MEISQVAIPMIEKVKSKLSGDIHMATYDQGDIIYLLRLGNQKKNWLKIGRRVRSHATAAGKLLLAFQSDEEIQRVTASNLDKYTNKTITCASILMKEIKKIRTAGYATSAEEFIENVYSIAVPIYNDSGVVIAAISLTRESPFPSSKIKEIVRELQLCSKLITENMGVNLYNDVP
jgi:DNA-binding IclR family transcriptional regulator